MPSKPIVFTSWKEIASYLGKGVRTVQRWEAQFGLPVQRPHATHKGIVRATRDELDRWVSTCWGSRDALKIPVNNELETLRRRVAELTSENTALKGELEERDGANGSPADSRSDRLKNADLLLEHCAQLLHRTAQLHLQFAETMDVTKNLKEIRRGTGQIASLIRSQ